MWIEVGVRHVRLVHLHEVDAHEERLVGFGRLVEILKRRLLDILVEERNPDHALFGRVDILAVDLEFFDRLFPCFAGERTLGHLVEHRAQLRVHVGEPGRVAIGVGIEVIEADSTSSRRSPGRWAAHSRPRPGATCR